jgi:23S rRNA pseudouridine1911/1915/1917 synthase
MSIHQADYFRSARKNPMTDPAVHEITATEEDSRQRLDMVLVRHLPHLSRSKLQSLVKSGRVTLRGETVRNNDEVQEGDLFRVEEEVYKPPAGARAEDIPLSILFEDEDLIVVNKPAGMVVHIGAGHDEGTLVNALLHHSSTLSAGSEEHRPGIVQRLDNETSGCIVVAKNDQAHAAISAQFADREVKKTYLAIIRGRPRHTKGTIDLAIGRHPVQRQKMTPRRPPSGRDAVTDYELLATKDGWTLVACMPRTGRTHQIRVHLQSLGHPIAGDPLYGKRDNFERHLLHAWKLEFAHPRTGEILLCTAPLPADFGLVPLPVPKPSSRK